MNVTLPRRFPARDFDLSLDGNVTSFESVFIDEDLYVGLISAKQSSGLSVMFITFMRYLWRYVVSFV